MLVSFGHNISSISWMLFTWSLLKSRRTSSQVFALFSPRMSTTALQNIRLRSRML